MPYYNECPFCGGSLDPGEKCDCQQNGKEVKVVAGGVTKRRIKNAVGGVPRRAFVGHRV